MTVPLARYFQHHRSPVVSGDDDMMEAMDVADLMGRGMPHQQACMVARLRRMKRRGGTVGMDFDDLSGVDDMFGGDDDDEDDDLDDDVLGDDDEDEDDDETDVSVMGASMRRIDKKTARVEARIAKVQDKLEDTPKFRKRRRKRLKKRLTRLRKKLTRLKAKKKKKAEKIAAKLGRPAAAAAIAAGAGAAAVGLSPNQVAALQGEENLAVMGPALGMTGYVGRSQPPGQEARVPLETALGDPVTLITVPGGTAAGTAFAVNVQTRLYSFAVWLLRSMDLDIQMTNEGAGTSHLRLLIDSLQVEGGINLLPAPSQYNLVAQSGQGTFAAQRTLAGLRGASTVGRNTRVTMVGRLRAEFATLDVTDVSIAPMCVGDWLEDDHRAAI